MYWCCSFDWYVIFFFFFKQKTAYEMRISDWSSDVCSSDLRPFLPLGRLALHRVGRESVELGVIGGMHRNQLALQMRRKLGDLDARLAAGARKFIAIILAFGGLAQIDAAAVPRRNLDAGKARIRHPSPAERRVGKEVVRQGKYE